MQLIFTKTYNKVLPHIKINKKIHKDPLSFRVQADIQFIVKIWLHQI